MTCSANFVHHAVRTRTKNSCGIIHSPSPPFLFTVIFTAFSQSIENNSSTVTWLYHQCFLLDPGKNSTVQLQAFKTGLHSKCGNNSGLKSDVWSAIRFKHKILLMALLKVPLSILQKLLSHSVHPAVLETPCTLAQ